MRLSIKAIIGILLLALFHLGCNSDLSLKLAHSGCIEDDCKDDSRFSILTESHITNNNAPQISWTALADNAFYLAEMTKKDDCKGPKVYKSQSSSLSVKAKIPEDGAYYICLYGEKANQVNLQKLNVPADNNGVMITIDTTPPVLTTSLNSVLIAKDVFDPPLEVYDLTPVTYSWQSASAEVLFDDKNGLRPGIEFTKKGKYQVTVTVTDAAGNKTSHTYTIDWGRSFSSTDYDKEAIGEGFSSLDYGLYFAKQFYQTRSIKRVLMDSDYAVDSGVLSVFSHEFLSIHEPDYQDGKTALLAFGNPALKGLLSYGPSAAELSYLDGSGEANKSMASVNLKDFTLMSLDVAKAENHLAGGLSGEVSSFGGGRYSSNGHTLTSGFLSIINE